MASVEIEIGARLSMMQSVLEHMLAGSLASDAEGARNLQFLKDSVKSAIIDHAQLSRALTEPEKAQYFDEAGKVTERFFERTETMRARLVEVKKSR